MNITEQNRQIIAGFTELFYVQKKVRKAFDEYVSEQYIQHNPNLADGKEAALEMLEPKFSNPEAAFEIKRILVDGNLAAIHLNGKLSANSLGVAVVDIYRIVDGKIVEHWDVLQPVPTESANQNSMF